MLFRFALRQGRWGLAGYSLLAFLLALLQAAGVYVGIDRVHDWIDPGSVAAASLLLLGLALSCFALTLLVCQLTPARMATAISGAVLLVLFLVNGLGRSLDWIRPWRWLSPFYYYDLSRPLAPGGA